MKRAISIFTFSICLAFVGFAQTLLQEDNIAFKYPGFTEIYEAQLKGDYKTSELPLKKFAAQLIDEGHLEDGLDVMFQYSKALMHQWKSSEALDVYYEMINISKENGLNQIYVDALQAAYQVLSFKEDFEEGRKLIIEAMKVEDVADNSRSDNYFAMGNILEQEGKLDSALIFVKKAFNLDYSIQDSSSLPTCCHGVAQIFAMNGELDSALHYLYLGMDYLREGKDEYKYPAMYHEMASVLLKMRNVDRAKHFAYLGIEKAESLGLKSTLAKLVNFKAHLFSIEGDCENAIKYYTESDEINSKSKTTLTKILNEIGRSECQQKLGKKLSPEILKELNAYKEQTPRVWTQCRINLLLLREKSKNGISKEHFYSELNKLKKVVDETDLIFLKKDLSELEYSFLTERKEFELANDALLDYFDYKGQIDSEKQRYLAQELEARFNKKENDKQIELLAAQNEINKVKLGQQNFYLIVGSIAFLIFGLLMFFVYQLYSKVSSQKNDVSNALEEKEFLLKEIHHRVKNNLQVISSLLSLQSRQIEDPDIQKAINEGRNRVRSMALIHQNLYQNEKLSGVSIKRYLEQLVEELFSTYKVEADRIALKMDIQDLNLDIDTMVPLGLILNELVSNCLKHAFPDQRNGLISIGLYEKSNQLHLSVRDNGVGSSVSLDDSTKTFGNRLIKSFCHKLKAEMMVKTNGGTEIIMDISNYQKVA